MGSILVLAGIGLIAVIGLIVGVLTRNRGGILTAVIATIVLGASWIFLSVVQIETGHGGVRASFGAINVDTVVLGEGLQLKKPWETIYTLSHQQLSEHRNATDAFEKAVKAKMRIKGIPEAVIEGAFVFPLMDVRKVVPVDQGLLEQISMTQEAVEKQKRKQTEIENARLDAQKRGEDGTAIRQTILRVLYDVDLAGALPEGAKIPEGTSLAEISQFILAIAEIKRADAVEIAAEKGDLTVMVTSTGANTSLPLPAAANSTPVAVPVQE